MVVRRLYEAKQSCEPDVHAAAEQAIAICEAP